MRKYEVRLESQTDSQARITSIEAENEQAARAACEQAELDLATFSLLPPEKSVWEQPPGGPDSKHGVVDLSRWDAYDPSFAQVANEGSYEDAVSAAKGRLQRLEQRIDIAPNGKVRASSLSSRAKSRLFAHKQTEPYAVTEVREVTAAEVDAQRLVRQLAALKGTGEWAGVIEGMRDQGIPLAAVTAFLYGKPWQAQIDGSGVTVYSTAAVQCSLHTAYTGDQDAHDFANDWAATEITGTGYSANGVTLASKTTNYTTGTDQIWLDAADVSWTTSTLSATDSILWVNTAGANTTDPLWANIDFGATVSTTAGTFQITFDATGIVNFDIT